MKSEDESISDIGFRTTPKGGLPHYYYNIRKSEALVKEMTNVACSRLGDIIHLQVQKGKVDMKTSIY